MATAPFRFELWARKSGTNVGNCSPLYVAGGNGTIKCLSFLNDVEGDAFGRVLIPDNIAGTPNPYVNLYFFTGATSGVTRLNIGTRVTGDADSVDGSYTFETAQDITVPGTTNLLKVVRFPATSGDIATSFSGAAGKFLGIHIQHLGAHANDTLAQPTNLIAAILKADV